MLSIKNGSLRFDVNEPVRQGLWGDALLIKRFLSQCSRTGSSETVRGYRRQIREFTRWRDRNHPHLHLREINAAFCQDWVSHCGNKLRPDS